jgi:biopolymer transport protein ExbD
VSNPDPTIIAGATVIVSAPGVGGGTVIAGGNLPPPGPPEDEPPSLLAARPKRRERLEFALPTINVIFLLMLYFLLAGTLVQRNEMGVVPPETSQFPKDRLPRPLLLISEAGGYSIDGLVVDAGDLVGAAKSALANPKALSTQLNILAPADMGAAQFLDVLSQFDAASVPVRVVTLDKKLLPGGGK